MQISDSDRERLQFAGEELADLQRLVQQNQENISTARLNAIGRLTEAILETQKNLQQFRKTNERQRTKTKGIRSSILRRWVNFTTTVQATNEHEAINIAGVRGLKDFTIKTSEEVNSLEDLFEHSQRWPARVECLDEEEIDEEEEEEEASK